MVYNDMCTEDTPITQIALCSRGLHGAYTELYLCGYVTIYYYNFILRMWSMNDRLKYHSLTIVIRPKLKSYCHELYYSR